jgi:serine/threonine protein kinase
LLHIVHRDVSPHNVLVSRDGTVKLIDFGIARAATRATHTKTGHMRGKLAYAAPEQVSAGAVDSRSDVFSLGVLLYEAATLERPFSGDNELDVAVAIMDGRHKSLLELRPDARGLAAVVERAISPDPAARWQTAKELGEALVRELGVPLPGPQVLKELVEKVQAERDTATASHSGPAFEVAMTTLTGSAPRSGETETVADSVGPDHGVRGREISRPE